MPGRYGDILWACPTLRALAEAYGTLITLAISPKYAGLQELLTRQPYLEGCDVVSDWDVQETAPMTPRMPPNPRYLNDWDVVYHLGYEGWPEPTLAEDVYRRATVTHLTRRGTALPWMDLTTPWITPAPYVPTDTGVVWVGWSEEYFELKVGILVALAARFREQQFWWLRPWGGRYDEVDKLVEEGWVTPMQNLRHHRLGPNVGMIRTNWVDAAGLGASARCYLGCLSSQWVLANGLGKACVVVEPNPQRHHPTFWRESPFNHLVRGLDGLPTFDARHAGDVLEEVLR
jgi:hypothetical protein